MLNESKNFESLTSQVDSFLIEPNKNNLEALIQTILAFLNSNKSTLTQERLRKGRQKGFFEQGIILDSVKMPNGEIVNFNKLVRDKIPETINTDNKTAVTHLETGLELLARAKTKLKEELQEFLSDPSLEEAGDITEVAMLIIELNSKSA